ncbi:MAG: tetratricopeptide repeat protein, partial [Candidatus Omnitrophota bacterium]|nr:tetratricopeptide repeat protein [Candidatus Omnitrophota bacterium]
MALICLALLFLPNAQAFSQTQAADYLCELGKNLYAQGKTEEALSEFNKVLLIDSGNEVAKDYINKIFKDSSATEATVLETPAVQDAVQDAIQNTQYTGNSETQTKEKKVLTKEEAMNQELAKIKQQQVATAYLYGYPDLMPEEEKEDRGLKVGPLKITGEAQLSFGITPHDFIWKRANFDLNEKYKSWRPMSYDGFNRGFNTYDSRVYDSLSVNVDTENEGDLNFHTNVTVDPWSFTGKGTDSTGLPLYYWSNTGYTVNSTAYSASGAVINLGELKVEDGKTSSAIKIDREFQPIRELWLDYTNDQIKFRAFPLGYQDQAYTSDDPMGITNHHIWWQDSPWLRRYLPGTYRSTGTPNPSFTKGYWDDSLSFLSKDSTGKYLTALRGFSFSFAPQEQTSFDTTIATPKHLWQDYGVVDNVISASRLKHYFTDNFMLGGTFTTRTGFKTDPQKLDSENFVGGLDLGYEIVDGIKAQAEVLTSQSFYDMTNSDYETKSRGNAYYFAFISRYPQKSIMDLKYGYDEIAMDEEECYLLKTKFYLSRMDQGFDSSLSNFSNTRQDTGWSRHIHFRRPMEYYYLGLTKPADADKWGQLNATRIGDGIDAGRNVLGFRFESFLDDRFYNLFDVRNVHNVNGKFIENVVRDEVSLRVTDKLTAKLLGIYQKLPKTLGGIDPFIYNGNTGDYFINANVADGQDVTIKTGSFGLNYDFFDWLSLNGIYERTNDYSLGYDNFPRNVLRNDTTLGVIYYQNDNAYRYVNPFLYDQKNFPQAPYEFYNIFKMGLRVSPLENMDIYLDYTRNEFQVASLNSDNMNHVGLEITYMPTPKFGML